MKTTFTLLILTALATAAAVLSIANLVNEHAARHETLRKCAEAQNVYACKFVAMPVTPAQVKIVQAPILPFPAL